MTLKYLGETPVLTHCPVCGHYWPENYEGDTPRWKHLSEHDPKDFGLTPLGKGYDSASEPLFEPVDELEGGAST